ncbi:hypothetical protein F2Q68_00039243 [Brassica cretica]|uniref:Uncharacterized protein n=1 Tax=Brassica cretica TaxID=69181 RepID=A0A8S9MFU4_BRACR|nr:hypothetical protein F2Q68_00039243 [Brassica cretica]
MAQIRLIPRAFAIVVPTAKCIIVAMALSFLPSTAKAVWSIIVDVVRFFGFFLFLCGLIGFRELPHHRVFMTLFRLQDQVTLNGPENGQGSDRSLWFNLTTHPTHVTGAYEETEWTGLDTSSFTLPLTCNRVILTEARRPKLTKKNKRTRWPQLIIFSKTVMSPFLELDMGHRRFNRNGTALVQTMGTDREQAVMNSVSWPKLGQAQCSSHQVLPAQLAGLLAHSAGSAGSQLNSAGSQLNSVGTRRSLLWVLEPKLGPRGDVGIQRFFSCIGVLSFLLESYYAFEAVLEPEGLDPEIVVWNPEEPGGSSLDCEIFDWNPEAIGELGGTVLRLPRQDYYRYLFGFRILLLGRWPLSSSYAVFYFCRKSLTGLEGAGVGVVTQVPGLRSFPPRSILIHVLFTLVLWGPRCALGCTGVSGSFDSILRLAHTHSCFMSHTRFDSLWACHCGRATFVRVGQDRRSLET